MISRQQTLLCLIIVLFVSTAGDRRREALIQFDFSSVKLCDGFLEKNDLRIPVTDEKLFGGVTQAEFNASIDRFERIYSAIFAQKGLRLQMKKLWENSQVNAVAYKENGYSVIEIWGGLGRHATMSADAVTLVTCHEIGHHLAGVPKFTSTNGGNWASVEGQADYFATLKCLRKVFAAEADSWNGHVDPIARERCNATHAANSPEAKVCMRTAMASIAAANLSASLSNGGSPRLDTRDKTVVTRTYEKHPAAQCRLDTYFNGDLCQVSDKVDFSNSNPDVGACRNVTEEEYGARARCWYKPTTGGGQPPVQDIAATPSLNGQESLSSRNPNQVITFAWNVSAINGAYGVYFEVIGPNRDFSDSNGVSPDPFAMPGNLIAQTRGQIHILPSRQLPGWGVYKFRVIALDRRGQKAVGRFSNSATLNLWP